jgi:hypothetical protein
MRDRKGNEGAIMMRRAAKGTHGLKRALHVGVQGVEQRTHGVLAYLGIVISLGAIALAGCGGATNVIPNGTQTTPPSPFPIPPVPTVTNTYLGTQGPGVWTYTIDNIQGRYSYQALTYPGTSKTSTAGSFVPLEGFLELSDSLGGPAGYGLEIPSRAALLRPGDGTTNLVTSVQMLSCFPLLGNVKFQFVSLPAVTTYYGGSNPGYGSVSANTSADGSTWQFGGMSLLGPPPAYVASGPHPGSQVTGYPNTFSGTCSSNNGQVSISIPAMNSTPAATFLVGPTGFIMEDQSVPNPPANYQPAASMFGVVQPSAPLVTANIVTGKYLGFMYTPNLPGGVHTQMIGFGQTISGSGTSMTGGTWLNNDLTQLQNTDMVLNLGTQDSTNNGLYTSATLTMADPTYLCSRNSGLSGLDANGFPTCTFDAVAIAGNPENKFAIFVSAETLIGQAAIYLFQQ